MDEVTNIVDLVELISKKMPLQKNKLKSHLAAMDEKYFSEANEFIDSYSSYLKKQNVDFNFVVDAYIGMCKSMLKCQIEFMKTGKYTIDSSSEALNEVYNNPIAMKSYMIALAASQFLWGSHYEMLSFFKKLLASRAATIGSYLEIGPGHGLFLDYALKVLDKVKRIDAVDISATSIELSQSILDFFHPANSCISYHTMDILDFEQDSTFDFVTMGEVIEHVNNPLELLRKLSDLLSDNGVSFLSTAINAPAVDHVYHFKTVQEVRDMLDNANLSILTERVLPVENLPMDEIVKRKITINYCAEVRRKK
jgi:SAM-dependent methyltransferase